MATLTRSWRAALTPARAIRFLGLVLVLGCSSFQLASKWTPTSALTEGKSEAWAGLPGHYFSEQNIFAGASNDSDYLHLLVRFRMSDLKWARACALNGLTVWLDPSGKKKRTLGIRVAAGPEREDPAMPTMGGNRPDQPAFGENMRPRLDGQLEIKTRGSSIVIPADGSNGPKARFINSYGMCTYELSVPLNATAERWVALGGKPGASVMLGLTAGLSEEERAAMKKRLQEGRQRTGDEPGGAMGGGPPGGAGRGPSGGGTGGGPPGGMSGHRPEGGPGGEDSIAENPEVWVRVQLARSGEVARVEE